MFDNDLLHLVSYVAAAGAFLFILLSLASGLLYVAEVIEEHSAVSKTIGQRAIYVIIVLLVGLHFIDSLPLHLTLLCIFSHLVYLQNFSRTWPSISLASPAFVLSCILVIASHFVAFSHFSLRARGGGNSHGYNYGNGGGGTWGKQGRHGGWRNGRRLEEDSFMDVATFFGVCVWLVPFYLFLSLSANDNVLPSSGDSPSSPMKSSKSIPPPAVSSSKSSLLGSFISSGFALVPSLRRAPHGNHQRDGLIALSTPSSPAAGAYAGSSRFPFEGLTSPGIGGGYSPGIPGYASPVGQYSSNSRLGGGGAGSAFPFFPPSASPNLSHPSAYTTAPESPRLSPPRTNQGNYTNSRPTLRLPIPPRRHTDIGAMGAYGASDSPYDTTSMSNGGSQYGDSPMSGRSKEPSPPTSPVGANAGAWAGSAPGAGPGLTKRK